METYKLVDFDKKSWEDKGYELYTRSGNKARILCTDADMDKCIVAHIDNFYPSVKFRSGEILTYHENGRYLNEENEYDLMMKVPVQKVYFVVRNCSRNPYSDGVVYHSRKEAESVAVVVDDCKIIEGEMI